MTKISDHAEQAVARLLEQFQRSSRLHDLIGAFISPLQELEDIFQDLLDLRALDTAFGAQLDGLGEIVDEARQGRNDEDYRDWLKLRIFINVSKGRPEDLIHVLKVISQATQVRLFENYPASLEMFTDGPTISEAGEFESLVLGLDDGAEFATDDGGGLYLLAKRAQEKPFLVRFMESLAGGGIGPVPVVISQGENPLAFGADPDTGLFALDDGGLLALEDTGNLLTNSTDTETGSYGEGGHLAEIGFDEKSLEDGGYMVFDDGGRILILDRNHQNVIYGDGKITEVLQ